MLADIVDKLKAIKEYPLLEMQSMFMYRLDEPTPVSPGQRNIFIELKREFRALDEMAQEWQQSDNPEDELIRDDFGFALESCLDGMDNLLAIYSMYIQSKPSLTENIRLECFDYIQAILRDIEECIKLDKATPKDTDDMDLMEDDNFGMGDEETDKSYKAISDWQSDMREIQKLCTEVLQGIEEKSPVLLDGFYQKMKPVYDRLHTNITTATDEDIQEIGDATLENIMGIYGWLSDVMSYFRNGANNLINNTSENSGWMNDFEAFEDAVESILDYTRKINI